MRIGVFICHCGSNIAGTVDCAQVAAIARTFPDVVYADDPMYTCAEPGQGPLKRPFTSTSSTAWLWPPARRACTSPPSAARWNAQA